MKSLIKLTDFSVNDINSIFTQTDEILQGNYQDCLKGKSVVMFFPASSIRTRVTFEKAVYLMGGQSILFPTETLDKKEDLQDVFGYLNNWADLIVIRHKKLSLIEEIARYAKVPVINAMTDENHPCEILSDLYALSKVRKDFSKDSYLFVGQKGNIGLSWKEASAVYGFPLEQCCGKGYEIDGLVTHYSIGPAVQGKDIVCTDSLPAQVLPDFKDCQVTKASMDAANKGALINPCPPFYRGEEVSQDVIDSAYFVGYAFKKHLLEVQQAIIIYCLL